MLNGFSQTVADIQFAEFQKALSRITIDTGSRIPSAGHWAECVKFSEGVASISKISVAFQSQGLGQLSAMRLAEFCQATKQLNGIGSVATPPKELFDNVAIPRLETGISVPCIAAVDSLREAVLSAIRTREALVSVPPFDLRAAVAQAFENVQAKLNAAELCGSIGSTLNRIVSHWQDEFPQMRAIGLRDLLRIDPVFDDGVGEISVSNDQAVGNNDPEDRAAESSRSSSEVVVCRFPPDLLKQLQLDPQSLYGLTPNQFEELIADRFDAMGFDVTRTGAINRPDGGIDLIARSRRNFGFGTLLAIQCEHHRFASRKTGGPKVSGLLRWKGWGFNLGVVVTNTSFTDDARLVAAGNHIGGFLRLCDLECVLKWIRGNHAAVIPWPQMPTEIQLTPKHTIRIPRPCLEY